jgi:hypothetical protein
MIINKHYEGCAFVVLGRTKFITCLVAFPNNGTGATKDAQSKRPGTQKIKKNKSPINKNIEEKKGMFITLRWYVSKQ